MSNIFAGIEISSNTNQGAKRLSSRELMQEAVMVKLAVLQSTLWIASLLVLVYAGAETGAYYLLQSDMYLWSMLATTGALIIAGATYASAKMTDGIGVGELSVKFIRTTSLIAGITSIYIVATRLMPEMGFGDAAIFTGMAGSVIGLISILFFQSFFVKTRDEVKELVIDIKYH
jgi:hypothetical protein